MSLRAQRGPVRSSFTRSYNELKQELDKGEGADIKLLKSMLKRLDMMLADATEEELTNEFDSVMEYKDKFSDVQLIVNELCASEYGDSTASRATYIERQRNTAAGGEVNSKPRYKLPKLELRKFGGDPKKWLDFWCQFKGIHEDKVLSTEEKFQYLIQTMVEKSPAEDIVLSFPPTEANYPLAIDHLKSRFGQEKI